MVEVTVREGSLWNVLYAGLRRNGSGRNFT
ncbi:MAG: hypothetical protein CM1200mP10_21880 [Candidatus Neomarinimicrobiota bacterium]|nr:MAG: hypothetical protein CM1200mP10_21880 [Candidatus Neomarinimicrobiota bacterium]